MGSIAPCYVFLHIDDADNIFLKTVSPSLSPPWRQTPCPPLSPWPACHAPCSKVLPRLLHPLLACSSSWDRNSVFLILYPMEVHDPQTGLQYTQWEKGDHTSRQPEEKYSMSLKSTNKSWVFNPDLRPSLPIVYHVKSELKGESLVAKGLAHKNPGRPSTAGSLPHI